MKTFKAIWNWLDGKKTNIAMGLFLTGQILSLFVSQFLSGIWNLPPPVHLPQIIASINWIATLFGSTGLLHQAVKSANSKAANI